MIHKKRINCDLKSLQKLRSFVSNVLDKEYSGYKKSNLLVLAIDEVCSNLMQHSHRCNVEDTFEVRVIPEKENVTFEIEDDKMPGFDISDYRTPCTEEIVKAKQKNGIGLMLVKKIMDSIQLENKPQGHICRLSKKIKAQP